MIKSAFKLVAFLLVVLVVGIVAYNYFLGTEEEQENSRRIIDQVRGLGSSVVNLLYSEKEKFDQGKYDSALEKIGDAIELV